MAVGMDQLADSLLRAGLLTDTEFESVCHDLSAAEAVSFELDANFQRMLAKSPEDRFQRLSGKQLFFGKEIAAFYLNCQVAIAP